MTVQPKLAAPRGRGGDPAYGEPVLVTVHVWRVAGTGVPAALLRMARDRPAVRSLPFGKLLGTGDGETFAARDFVITRYVLLAAWPDPQQATVFEQSATVRGWDRIARERCRIRLRPWTSRGRWSGRNPFDVDPADAAADLDGPVAAITRARLRPRAALSFWRSVPPVARDLQRRPGLLSAFGIGEAPVGIQGTFSLWRSAADLRAFAYEGSAHRDVIRRTPDERWYAEELFARFVVVGIEGTMSGHDPLQSPAVR